MFTKFNLSVSGSGISVCQDRAGAEPLGLKLIKTSVLKCMQKMKWQSELQYLLYYLNYKAKKKLKKGMAFRMDILQAFRWLLWAKFGATAQINHQKSHVKEHF